MLRPLLVGLLAAGGLVIASSPAQADACAGTEGVTVVVDFGTTQVVRCAPGDPTSGLDALTKAGFGYTFERNNPGFVCTIDGAPADRNCMKPNYWAYWHSGDVSGSGGWAYSNLGAGSYDPAPGTSEGWSFTGSANTPPNGGASNDTELAASPSPTPQPSKAPAGGSGAGSGAGGGTGSGTGTGTGEGSTGTSGGGVTSGGGSELVTVTRADGSVDTVRVSAAKADRLRKRERAKAAASPGASVSPEAVSSAQAVYTPDAAQTPQPQDGALPWWWGLVALAGLGAAAGGTAYARRRRA